MRNKHTGIVWQTLTALALILADRLVKMFILNTYEPGEFFGEIPYVADFIFVKNTGAAFSILSNNTGLLSAISVIFVIAILAYRFIKKPQGFFLNLSLVLFFSGALGNGIDRIMYKFVVDFISIKWFNFPVFNIADVAIVSGAIALFIHILFFDESKEKSNG